DVYQMWTFEEVGDSLQLSKDLQESLRLVRWHENSSDVVQAHISKATGVKEVADKLGLSAENILVFGDGPND
ncbi:HAD hydrolase family protein, partial [Streptococcus suis]